MAFIYFIFFWRTSVHICMAELAVINSDTLLCNILFFFLIFRIFTGKIKTKDA